MRKADNFLTRYIAVGRSGPEQYQEAPLYKPAPMKSVLCRSSIVSAQPVVVGPDNHKNDVRVQLLGKVADITEDLCVTVSRDVRVTKFLDFHAVRRDGRINAVDNHGVSITRQVNDQLMCSGRAKARDIHFGHIASSCARDHYWCAAVNGVAEDACRIFEVDEREVALTALSVILAAVPVA